jgi:mRNA-degrading endonuclease RelE of RelBE toxin-antitoxin system
LSKKYPSLKFDFNSFLDDLEENPIQGTAHGKNCYKVRLKISSKNKGKSGGARVITNFHINKETIYLLSIYDKGEQETISNNELEELLLLINDEKNPII